MKLHDLRPAEGSRTAKTRVGRGIAAGKGKTAGRGTKGQKARAGGSIKPWFEGGQTPLHQRIPKLRGFKNRFKIEYEVVNVGAIAAAAERGAFETDPHAKGKTAPITINQDVLRAVGLVRTLNKPLKVLGDGELTTPLFVVADAFTATARTKIEAAGGSVTVLEVPDRPREALGVDTATEKAQPDRESEATPQPKRAKAKAEPEAEPTEAPEATTAEATTAEAKPARKSRAKAAAAEAPDPEPETEAAPSADAAATAEPDVDTEQPETESPSGDDA
jgi:large subunit ribosomal protein L15